MNKKRLDRGLYKSLAAILVANGFTVLSPVISNANQLTNHNISTIEKSLITNPEEILTVSNNLIDFNGSFEETITATGTEEVLWKDKIKPKYWEVQKYKNNETTSWNAPHGEIVSGAKEGNNAVKLVLDNSIGFFKTITGSSPKIEGGREYKLSTYIKTENLNNKSILIKVEQLDKNNKVLESKDIGTISEANDWTNIRGTITAKENVDRLRIVVQNKWLSDPISGNVYLDEFSLEELEKEPTSITLSDSSINITPGNSKKLDYTIEPFEANKQKVVWISSNENIVEVDEDGKITANNEGSATITATIENYPEVKAECIVNVKETMNIEKIEFESSEIAIENGKHYVVKAKTYPQYSNEEYSLEVEDENIAQIEDGIVKGIGTGKIGRAHV